MSRAKGDCFQLLGFDVFIDSNLKAWLFEINDHPSLNINLEKEGDKGLIKEVSEIDKYLKTKVLGEAIKLMSKGPDKRGTLESYKGFMRILPDPEYEEYNAFAQAKIIFRKLLGKPGNSLSMNRFAALSKLPKMTNDKMQKPHYEIAYKRITQQAGVHKMTLEIFFGALDLLSETFFPEIKGPQRVEALIAHLISVM